MRRARVLAPRKVSQASNGLALPPALIWKRRACATHAASPTRMPPVASLWPLRYLVVLCSTRSAPSASGRYSAGDRKVLSTTSLRPRRLASAASAGISLTRTSGLDAVSV
ncbi:hypothetical protein D3C81_1477870 [compost metagenome]